MAQFINTKRVKETMTQTKQVEQPRVRIVTGTFPLAMRDRLKLLQAKRYVMHEERESVEALVEKALDVGISVLEKQTK